MTHPSIARVCKCYSAVRCYTGHTGVARCTGVHWCCTGVDWSAFQSSLQTIERAASCAGTTTSRTLETSQRPDSIVILSIPQIDRGEIDSWRASRVVARLINRKHGAHLVLQSSAVPHRCSSETAAVSPFPYLQKRMIDARKKEALESYLRKILYRSSIRRRQNELFAFRSSFILFVPANDVRIKRMTKRSNSNRDFVVPLLRPA